MSFKSCEFGYYPDDWALSKLGDYITVLTDYHANGSYKKLKENVELLDYEEYAYMIRTTNFEQSAFNKSDFKYITEKAYNFLEKTKVFENDILMNKIANAGSVYLVPNLDKPISLAMNLFLIRMDSSVINQKYSYYFMKNYEKYIKTRAEGSVTKTITKDNVKKLKIAYPKIKEQEKIVKIIDSLDEKIETNNKINKTLEEMAGAIFKEWFVDFEFPNEEGKPYKSSGGEMVESELGMIPKGWCVSELNEIIINSKRSIKSKDLQEKIKYVPIDSMTMKSIISNNYKSKDEAKSSLILFDKFDILIGAMRVYFHRVNLALFDGVTRTTTFVLKSINENEIEFNLFLLNLDSTIAYAEKTSKGTTMPYAIWENGLATMKFINPTIDLKISYSTKIKKFIQEMERRVLENERLEKLRDTLLPKLMSGEIRVPLSEKEREEILMLSV